MFETLQERLSGIFDKLTGRGSLSEADVDAAMREVRRALIEADVALDVVRTFTDQVRAKRASARRSSNPSSRARWWSRSSMTRWSRRLARRPRPRSQGRAAGADPDGRPAGLGQDHDDREDRQAAYRSVKAQRVLMASLDTRRPAAQEQLAILGQQIEGRHLAHRQGREPLDDRQARHGRSAARRL